VGRRPLDGPLSPEGEIHHDGGIELTHSLSPDSVGRGSPLPLGAAP
jgi:hypothetical protein